jgi:predicted double-glycine peptidase
MKRLLTLLIMLAPCAGAASAELVGGGVSYRVPVTSWKEARFRSTVHQQFDFSCGSAALATLLSFHYGQTVTEQEVFQAMFAQGDQARIRREGFSLLDMKRYLAGRGLVADGFVQPLDTLAAAGWPAIVLVSEHGYQHFVVIKGVAEGRVLLGDPAGGTRALARPAFDAIWHNKLLFVIHGQVGKPQFNAPADWGVAPHVRVADAVQQLPVPSLLLPKLGAGDF